MPTSYQALRDADRVLRYLKGELTEFETTVFNDWLSADVRNRELLESIQDEEKLAEQLEFFSHVDSASAWESVQARHMAPVAFYKRISWKYAAAVFLCLSCAIAYYTSTEKAPQMVMLPRQKPQQAVRPDMAPGGDKARLTLSDGSVIDLENAGNGALATNAGIKITKKGGMLVYEVENSGAAAEAGYNTISTPRGGQYQVVLPDGSNVWLNASSSLNYPTVFYGRQRIVKLTGEAYFEVAKNKDMPFIVQANGAEVEVLGTHFNVKAYEDEASMNTTLVEGSVKVRKGAESRTIVPGQQARISKSNALVVADADVQEVIAWKDGMFLFNNEDVATVMRELGRWYDADISYEGSLPDAHFTGRISRQNNISKVLNLLELTGGVHFRIEDKKVKVYR